MLHDFIIANRERIIASARAAVGRRTAPTPTEAELEHGVPMFLTQLVRILAPESAPAPSGAASAAAAATVRGGELLRLGFTVGQVVADYGEICQAVMGIATVDDVTITALEFRRLNLALDDAIAAAVTEYARQRDRLVAENESERTAAFAEELRNLVSSATLAFEAIRTGSVGPAGTTGMVVSRSLFRIREILDRNLVHLRLETGRCVPTRFPIAMLLEEIQIVAMTEASRRSIELVMSPVDYHVEVSADRQMLGAAIENLLQNALRRTPSGGAISLQTTVDQHRVSIAIADACGGFPAGDAERTLDLCRRAVEACGGTLSVIDRPGAGCVFTIDLPRLPASN